MAFDALSGTATARTTPMGDSTSFTVTFDPSKMSAGDKDTRPAQWMAIDTGHEGTHMDDLTKMFAGSASALSAFSVEYRGYESSAFVFKGLFTPSLSANQGNVMGGTTCRTLGYGGLTIWNTSWAETDKANIQSRDTGITNAVQSVYGHPETKPHNPRGN